MGRSFVVWLLTAAVATLALFQDRPWKSLEVFNSDGGGYYVYLPAAFIYHDLGRADSLTSIQHAHWPERGYNNLGLVHLPNGNVIPKYSLGVALAELPWFIGAHLYARWHQDALNGFSRPYQQAIMVAGLCYALLGLWIVRKLLLHYYDDSTAAWALAGIGLGTNFLAYASYDAQMAHAYLMLWQAALLFCTVRWHEDFKPRFAVGMGLFLGLTVLTRPTEILFVLVPLAWGLSSGAAIRARLLVLRQHLGQLVISSAIFVLIVGLQALFWHAVSGHWLLYSYDKERFDFAHPHVLDGLFSFRKGWLLYTPLAAVALLGTWALRGRVAVAQPALWALVPVLLYVTFSWEQWWYGGGFSARPLISLYPLLALPLAALMERAGRWKPLLKSVFLLLVGLNLWQTYQYAAGVMHYENNTAELYFRNFLHPSL